MNGPFAVTFTFLGYDKIDGTVDRDYPVIRSTFTAPCAETGKVQEWHNDFIPYPTKEEMACVRQLFEEAMRIYRHELGEWFTYDNKRPYVNHG